MMANEMTNHQAATFITKQFLAQFAMHSCVNCEEWNTAGNKCDKYGMTPPAETILFSCGRDWVACIPF